LRVDQLRPPVRIAVVHRAARVEQHRAAEVRLLLVLADVEAVGLAEHAPVEVADLVAVDVLAVLLELHAEALVGRAVEAGAEPFDHQARQHLQVRDLLQVRRRQEFGKLCHLRTFITVPKVPAPDYRIFFASPRGVASRIFWMISSTVMPSASALNVATMRWRSTGVASAITSSSVTWKRPWSTARTLPPSTHCWHARGPAPHSTSSFTKAGTPGSFGRVLRTTSSTKSITWSGTSTFRTVSWHAMISAPEMTPSIFAEWAPVVRDTISRSSSRWG